MFLILIMVVRSFFEVLRWAILIDCVLSFVPITSLSEIRRIIYVVLRPIYTLVRKIVSKTPLSGGMLDFTPLFALLLLSLLSRIVITILTTFIR